MLLVFSDNQIRKSSYCTKEETYEVDRKATGWELVVWRHQRNRVNTNSGFIAYIGFRVVALDA